jgi:signal transduction histidine kinase
MGYGKGMGPGQGMGSGQGMGYGQGLGPGVRLRLPVLAVSVQLADGKWLNSETQLPSPGLWAWPTIVSTLLMAVAIIGIVLFSVRRITKPLRELAIASDRLGRGETVASLTEAGPEEIALASRAFNSMQERVSRFVADRTRMIGAISHDLRTPLTALRLRAEFIDDDDTRERIVASVEEMTRMTEATLAFARDDASQEETRSTDLTALVSAVADDFSDLGGDVTIEAPDRLEAKVRPVALRRALRNLVENAIRYGGCARIGLEKTGGEILIRVDDDGPGIPEDRMEDVFAPFTRLESSRNQETGGAGLGLSTARSIVHAHGGELRLANRPGGGLTATIHLPLAADR